MRGMKEQKTKTKQMTTLSSAATPPLEKKQTRCLPTPHPFVGPESFSHQPISGAHTHITQVTYAAGVFALGISGSVDARGRGGEGEMAALYSDVWRCGYCRSDPTCLHTAPCPVCISQGAAYRQAPQPQPAAAGLATSVHPGRHPAPPPPYEPAEYLSSPAPVHAAAASLPSSAALPASAARGAAMPLRPALQSPDGALSPSRTPSVRPAAALAAAGATQEATATIRNLSEALKGTQERLKAAERRERDREEGAAAAAAADASKPAKARPSRRGDEASQEQADMTRMLSAMCVDLHEELKDAQSTTESLEAKLAGNQEVLDTLAWARTQAAEAAGTPEQEKHADDFVLPSPPRERLACAGASKDVLFLYEALRAERAALRQLRLRSAQLEAEASEAEARAGVAASADAAFADVVLAEARGARAAAAAASAASAAAAARRDAALRAAVVDGEAEARAALAREEAAALGTAGEAAAAAVAQSAAAALHAALASAEEVSARRAAEVRAVAAEAAAREEAAARGAARLRAATADREEAAAAALRVAVADGEAAVRAREEAAARSRAEAELRGGEQRRRMEEAVAAAEERCRRHLAEACEQEAAQVRRSLVLCVEAEARGRARQAEVEGGQRVLLAERDARLLEAAEEVDRLCMAASYGQVLTLYVRRHGAELLRIAAEEAAGREPHLLVREEELERLRIVASDIATISALAGEFNAAVEEMHRSTRRRSSGAGSRCSALGHLLAVFEEDVRTPEYGGVPPLSPEPDACFSVGNGKDGGGGGGVCEIGGLAFDREAVGAADMSASTSLSSHSRGTSRVEDDDAFGLVTPTETGGDNGGDDDEGNDAIRPVAQQVESTSASSSSEPVLPSPAPTPPAKLPPPPPPPPPPAPPVEQEDEGGETTDSSPRTRLTDDTDTSTLAALTAYNLAMHMENFRKSNGAPGASSQ